MEYELFPAKLSLNIAGLSLDDILVVAYSSQHPIIRADLVAETPAFTYHHLTPVISIQGNFVRFTYIYLTR